MAEMSNYSFLKKDANNFQNENFLIDKLIFLRKTHIYKEILFPLI